MTAFTSSGAATLARLLPVLAALALVAASPRPQAQARADDAEERMPELVAEMPAKALEEAADTWRTSPETAAELARRMSLELRAVSPPGIEDGPAGLRSLSDVMRDTASTWADVEGAVHRADVALAVHHAREADWYLRRGKLVFAATQLRVAVEHLEEVRRRPPVADAQAAVDDTLLGVPDEVALRDEVNEVLRLARALQ